MRFLERTPQRVAAFAVALAAVFALALVQGQILYADFRHDDVVRTAPFTLEAA
jgi:hypothetical protein